MRIELRALLYILSFSIFILVSLVESSQAFAEAKSCKSILSKVRSELPPILPQTLLQMILFLHQNPEAELFISPELRSQISILADGDHNYASDEVLRKIVAKLEIRWGPEKVFEYIGRFLSGAQLAMQDKTDFLRLTDLKDMNRIFGWKLLSNSDPIYSHPSYLEMQMRLTNASGAGGFFGGDKASQLAMATFQSEWKKIAPKRSKVEHFTVTGAQANTLVYDVARLHVSSHFRSRVESEGLEVHFLVMSSMWVASDNLRATHLKGSYPGKKTLAQRLTIESPYTYEIDPSDPKEIQRLRPIEDRALKMIETKFLSEDLPIGAILLEPILGAGGVKFFRTEFMLRLRELCDRLKLPIVVDEILTGGGRTGKFFAYEHYGSFEPDFITFGKGLQVAGLASIYRERGFRSLNSGMVTSSANPHSLVKSAFLMRRIRESNLMQNAAEVGAYFLSQFRKLEARAILENSKKFGSYESDRMNLARGLGLMMYFGHEMEIGIEGSGYGRATPFLTLSKADVDFLLQERGASEESFSQGVREILQPKIGSAKTLFFGTFLFKTRDLNFSIDAIAKFAKECNVSANVKIEKKNKWQHVEVEIRGDFQDAFELKKRIRKHLDEEVKTGGEWLLLPGAREWNSTQKIVKIDINISDFDEITELRGFLYETTQRINGSNLQIDFQNDGQGKIWIAIPKEYIESAISAIVVRIAKIGKFSIEIDEPYALENSNETHGRF